MGNPKPYGYIHCNLCTAYLVSEPLRCYRGKMISNLGLSASLALKYWNQQTAVNRNLASNSYSMYLAHYIFVIVFQLVLFAVQGMPGLLKFGIVSVLSIMCAYIVSQFILKPFPRISVALVISLFAVMIFVIHP